MKTSILLALCWLAATCFTGCRGGATGGGEFVHASAPGVGVVIDSLNSSFYSRTYVGARRIL